MTNTYTKSLPLPDLQHTTQEFLRWVKPLVSDEQLALTTKNVAQFMAQEALQLHRRLQQWQTRYPKNWLAPLWTDSYLTFRGRVHTAMNYSIVLTQQGYEDKYTPAQLTASAVITMAKFYEQVVTQSLPQEEMRGEPVDTSQYQNLLRSMRIAQPNRDEFRIAEASITDLFFIVLHQENMYRVAVTNEIGEWYSEAQIAASVQQILQHKEVASIAPTYLTTAPREEAAKLYHALLPQNADNFKALEEALVVVSFDTNATTREDYIKRVFAYPENRYFDKTLEMVVHEDFGLAFNMEHTGIDGTTALRLLEEVHTALVNNAVQWHTTTNAPTKALAWQVTEAQAATLQQLRTAALAEFTNYAVARKVITGMTAKTIKNLGFSPDAYFHLALQMAQYRQFGKMRSTYEPVAMRLYSEGRTECVRPSTEEAAALITAITQGENIKDAMQNAANEHSRRIKLCASGNGIERHLFGLREMYERFGDELGITTLPNFFNDEGYKQLTHDFLSTSNITSPVVEGETFGPVVADGYGIFYSLTNERIELTISTQVAQQKEAVALLEQVEKAMLALQSYIEKADEKIS